MKTSYARVWVGCVCISGTHTHTYTLSVFLGKLVIIELYTTST